MAVRWAYRPPWILAGVAVFATACAQSGPSSELIMDQAVPFQVRQAATCYSFHHNASKYIFGVQLASSDHADHARYWSDVFERVEPNAASRERLLISADRKMEGDFPRRSAPEEVNAQVFNTVYGTVISTCEAVRAQTEGGDEG